jgi:hypothetical protein
MNPLDAAGHPVRQRLVDRPVQARPEGNARARLCRPCRCALGRRQDHLRAVSHADPQSLPLAGTPRMAQGFAAGRCGEVEAIAPQALARGAVQRLAARACLAALVGVLRDHPQGCHRRRGQRNQPALGRPATGRERGSQEPSRRTSSRLSGMTIHSLDGAILRRLEVLGQRDVLASFYRRIWYLRCKFLSASLRPSRPHLRNWFARQCPGENSSFSGNVTANGRCRRRAVLPASDLGGIAQALPDWCCLGGGAAHPGGVCTTFAQVA